MDVDGTLVVDKSMSRFKPGGEIAEDIPVAKLNHV